MGAVVRKNWVRLLEKHWIWCSDFTLCMMDSRLSHRGGNDLRLNRYYFPRQSGEEKFAIETGKSDGRRERTCRAEQSTGKLFRRHFGCRRF